MWLEGGTVSIWDDPEYREATRARAAAYVAFCSAATANPHRPWEAAWEEYFVAEVVPVRDEFLAASNRWHAIAAKIIGGEPC